jgi:hypothetical protein
LYALFLIHNSLGSNLCPLLEMPGFHFLLGIARDIMFNVCSSRQNCPARCSSAANVVCDGVNVFGTETASHNCIL